jgi:membrane protease YdiL (CAAX protease family)
VRGRREALRWNLPLNLRRGGWGWACVLAAPPVAWLLAAGGHGIVHASPLRDLALLALWSVAEEVVFRGGVQPALARQPWVARGAGGQKRMPWFGPHGVTLANLITSLLFALAHLWSHPPSVALGVLPVSLVLGASLERTGRLWVPVALHIYFNLCLYAASGLRGASL